MMLVLIDADDVIYDYDHGRLIIMISATLVREICIDVLYLSSVN